MSGELIAFPEAASRGPVDLLDRLERLAAIFVAIDAGEMLTALPDCAIARRNHLAALDLLRTVEIEINCICVEVGRGLRVSS